jgi:DNA-binding SARP family transcriptional activator/tetratricopeptide (TPR) repeat protein
MRFEILGPMRISDGDASRPVTGMRQRILLGALLAHANQPMPAEQLAEFVWNGEPPAGAVPTLRTYVARLRRSLGPRAAERVLTRDLGYLVVVAPDEVDALAFEALCQETASLVRARDWAAATATATDALALWRGPALVDVPGQVLRDAWLPRLEEQRVQLGEWQAEAELNLGRHEQLIPRLRALTDRYPLRERFHAQLMLALVRSGRQAEALTAYQQARHVLIDELGIEPGPELRRLHERILDGDADPIPPRRAEPSGEGSAPAQPVPRQLPVAVRHFTGRRAELDALTRMLDEAGESVGTVVISAIDGMAGIGKTALAVHVAHRLAEKFPDGQLFLDLHGYTQGHPPRTPDEALTWLLRALGVPPARIPADRDEAAALYRQRLADTRTLIVLDNAATEAQVRPLLPGSGSCLVLVTSRRRLRALDDAHSVSLDLLSPPDAVTLLHAVAGAGRIPVDDPQLGEVAELCGYLPLALRIAASLLRHRPSWPLEYLAGRLRNRQERVTALSDGDRELAAVFDLSYTSLEAPHRLLWRRLGLVPGAGLDAYAAAALVESDPVSAAALLEDLVDHNLLTAYAAGRYRLHDLLRAHARGLAGTDPEPEREAAADRLLRYYAHTAQAASTSIALYPRPRPDGPAPAHAPALADAEPALAWLRVELPNLYAAFTHAHTNGLEEHAIALAAGLAEILQADGPYSRALEIHRIAADAAELLGDRPAQADALNELGHMRAITGDYPGADDALTRALGVYRTLGTRPGEGSALIDLGRVRALAGDLPGAEDALARALQIYRTLGHRLGEANALNDLGRVRFLTGDFPEADDAHTRALELYRALGHPSGEAGALNELGRIRARTGDYPGADVAHTRALELYRALDHRTGQANALNELARVRTETGNYSGADDAHTQALEIYRALGHSAGEAGTLASLGRVRALAQDYPGADDALCRALDIYRALGDRGNEAWALNYYAAALAATGQRPRALEVYRQALAMNRELNKPDDEATSLEGIAEHYLAVGDTSQGIAYLNQALEIYRRLGIDLDTRRVQERLDGLTAG